MTKIKNFSRLNDYFFKKLMGQPERKALALDFLNTTVMVDRHKTLVDLKFLNPDYNPDRIDGKLSRLDIQAQADDGTFFDIEMQATREDFFPERSLFYLSRIYGSQLFAGDPYPLLKETIGVNLMNFKLDQLENLPSWHNYACFCVPNTKAIISRHLEMHFFELPKLTISDIKKVKRSEVWGAYFSGKYSDKQLEVLSMANPLLKKALDYETFFNSNDKLRREYLAREEAILDERIRNGYAKQQGIEQGIEQGIGIGEKKGKREEKIDNAAELLNLGVEPEVISKGIKLSIEEVMALKRKLGL